MKVPYDICDHLPVGVIKIDPDGLISYANGRAATAFAPVQPVGLAFHTLLAMTDADNVAALSAVVEAGASVVPVRIVRPDGQVLECRCARLPDLSVAVTLSDLAPSDAGSSEVSAHSAHMPPAAAQGVSANGRYRHVRELLGQAAEAGAPLAVLCIGLNRLKNVNYALGHDVGEELLTKVTERLRAAVRPADFIVPLGGGEFSVVQTQARPEEAKALATQLIDLIGRTYVVKGHMVQISARIGIAIGLDTSDDPETLLRHANVALNQATDAGSSEPRFYEPAMDAALSERRELGIDLRKALVLGQFELVFQPQYRLHPRALTGFEALLRWHHPLRGEVSPTLFVPLAEELGLIGAIGEWVLQTACREAAGWAVPVSIGVNVSPLQFHDGRLVDAVRAALDASGLAPDRLDLEITEGALLDNTSVVLDVFRALRSLGVRVSMDDFGTGYSSLSYLQKFPFDKIKIDQSFVRGSDASGDSRAIVDAIAALGTSLGMKTVAEGVETDQQMARVHASGCSEVQGYLTGRPMTAAAAAALAATETSGPEAMSGTGP